LPDRTRTSRLPYALRRIALLALLAVAATPIGSAHAYAPVGQPGPPLDVPPAKLAAALVCGKGVDGASRAPVLLVPGTGATADDNYSWNYEPQFDKLGIPWCAVTFPSAGNNDVQINGEYVVYAIRTMFARAGRRIAILGHSQGGMVPRWALRWWPDTRTMVDDVIGMAGTNHGTTMAHADCPRGCIPADTQQASDSKFIPALNSGQETFPGISYTEIYSHTDEEVQPNLDSNGTSSLHGGGGRVTNVAVQDICPTDTSEHLSLGTIDTAAYALAVDALDHDGPADPSRIPLTVCAQPLMPGINPITFPLDAGHAAFDVETSSGDTVTHEPPLACYVFAACPSQQPAPAPGAASRSGRARCAAVRRIVLRLPSTRRARITSVVVYIDGRRVESRHGRRLAFVRLPALEPRSAHVIRVVLRASSGRRRTLTRRVSGCS
jgi:triacylglycerol esterase/lipase EstA (alpha/beta hydrolase family)